MTTCPQCGSTTDDTFRFCPSCGASFAAGASNATPSSPQRPKGETRRLAAVLLAGLILGAAIGAVAYWALSNATSPLSGAPVVAFSSAVVLPSETHIPVASVSRALPPTNFLVRLVVNDSSGTAVAMPGNLSRGDFSRFQVGDDGFAVFWKDGSSPGLLDTGDVFLITYVHGTACPTRGSYFSLLWMDRSEIATVPFQWDCTSKVNVALGQPTAATNSNGTLVPVTSVSAEVLKMNFMIRILIDKNLSEPMWMDGNVGNQYNSGMLTAGDALYVGYGMRMMPGIPGALYIMWRDGSLIASTNWIT